MTFPTQDTGAPATPDTPDRPDTRIIAIVGVDGAGKTTVIGECRRQGLPEGARYLVNGRRRNAELFGRYHHRSSVPEDYHDGTFATARPYATAFDLFEHYDRDVRPLLGQVPFLVCDRYVPSAVAYFAALGHPFRSAVDFFANLRPADLIVHLRVDADRLRQRYDGRGGAREDEVVELMRRHGEAMDDVLPKLPGKLVVVDNNGPLPDTLSSVADAIRAFAGEGGGTGPLARACT
jgi:thymidylate kinase